MNNFGHFNNSFRLLLGENSISRVNGLAGKGLRLRVCEQRGYMPLIRCVLIVIREVTWLSSGLFSSWTERLHHDHQVCSHREKRVYVIVIRCVLIVKKRGYVIVIRCVFIVNREVVSATSWVFSSREKATSLLSCVFSLWREQFHHYSNNNNNNYNDNSNNGDFYIDIPNKKVTSQGASTAI